MLFFFFFNFSYSFESIVNCQCLIPFKACGTKKLRELSILDNWVPDAWDVEEDNSEGAQKCANVDSLTLTP